VIYSSEPTDWRDLQNKVCEILQTCGYLAETEKTIDSVRGKVAVDVYAVDKLSSPNLNYLCECKHWSTAVPKNVVHSFRTVVADCGAHVGFIISRSGFQSGAYEAAAKSNIRLVDWDEFQSLYLEKWKESSYSALRPLFEELFEFYDYLSAPIGNAISGNKDRMDEYNALLKKYSPQADANPWNRMVGEKRFPPTLPHRVLEVAESGNFIEHIFNDYASLYDWYELRTTAGLKEFRQFVSRYRTGPVIVGSNE
jgi:Restriction endonuclease